MPENKFKKNIKCQHLTLSLEGVKSSWQSQDHEVLLSLAATGFSFVWGCKQDDWSGIKSSLLFQQSQAVGRQVLLKLSL